MTEHASTTQTANMKSWKTGVVFAELLTIILRSFLR